MLRFDSGVGETAPVWLFSAIIDEASAPRAAPRVRAALDVAMDRYASGDDAAFRQVYAELLPRLRGFLTRLSGSTASAEDLAQEALLRIHRARGSFEDGAAALPWAFAIARNVFLDHARGARVRPKSVGGTTDEEAARPESVARDGRPDEHAAAKETLDLVRKTLDTLPVAQREAFILIRFEGLSVEEAAEVQGATESAVKVRAFRAYEALRAALAKAEEGAS